MPKFSQISWNEDAMSYAKQFGLDPKDVELIVSNATKGTLDPHTHVVGHLVVRYLAGDVIVVVGHREKDHPKILSVQVWTPGEQHGNNRTAKGGHGSSLPKSDRDLRKKIMERGYKILPGNHPKVVDVETDQVLMTIAGTASDHRTIPNDWKRFLKKDAENRFLKRQQEK